MSLSSGMRLGPYEVLSKIGAGGMGEVYKARDTRLDRTVAIKTSVRQFSERFEREARTVAALNHPHICTLHDVGPDYLVMEYIEGEPLNGPLPLDRALAIAADIADALDAAHRKGIVHRDLKPANILLTKKGVKLLDFGLAKITAKAAVAEETVTQALSQEGSIIGTLQYMSPEQLQGREADSRSDIFSFGCVLYELLAGRRAFEAGNSASLIASILKDEPPALSDVAQVSPAALDRVVKKCLAKDPDARWQSASDLRDELLWIASGGGQQASAAAPARRPSRLPWIAAACCAALAAVFAGLAFRQAPAASSPKLVRFQPLLPDDAAPNLTVSPDGEWLTFVRGADTAQRSLWSYHLASGRMAQVPESNNARSFVWGEGGHTMVIRREDKWVTVDLASGTIGQVFEGRGAFFTWTPSGWLMYTQAGLALLAPNAAEPRQLTRLRDNDIGHLYPSWIQGTKRFLYMGGRNAYTPGEIRIASLDGEPERLLFRSDSAAQYVQPGYLVYLKGDSLVAQPFDAKRAAIAGPARIILDRVARGAFGEYQPAISLSQNGVLAYRRGTRYRQSSLRWYDRDGKPLDTVGDPGDYSNPALSPDGTRLAVGIRDPQVNTRDIWVFDLARGNRTRLTFDEGDDYNPVWSPDGARIAYSSRRAKARDIYVRSAGGAGEEELLLGSDVDKSVEAWSPDGRFLSFALQSPGNPDLYLVPVAGKERKPVVLRATRYQEQTSKYSPDGRLIAYKSTESGRPELFVQTVDPNGGRWQISTSGGDEPEWRADGKELYYAAADDFLMAVDIVRTGETVRAGTPRKLFRTAPYRSRRNRYVVTSDGRKFLVITPEPEQVERPTVVLNWPLLLKKQ